VEAGDGVDHRLDPPLRAGAQHAVGGAADLVADVPQQVVGQVLQARVDQLVAEHVALDLLGQRLEAVAEPEPDVLPLRLTVDVASTSPESGVSASTSTVKSLRPSRSA
jgi:hypothetical protein